MLAEIQIVNSGPMKFPRFSVRILLIFTMIWAVASLGIVRGRYMVGLKERWRAIGGWLPKEIFEEFLPPLGWSEVRLNNPEGEYTTSHIRDLLEEMTTYGGATRLGIRRLYVEKIDGPGMSTDDKLIEILSKMRAQEVMLIGWNEEDEVVSRLPTQIKKYSFYIQR